MPAPQVTLYGAMGTAANLAVPLASYPAQLDASTQAVAVAVKGLDVGPVQSVGVVVPAGQVLAAKTLVVVGPSASHQVRVA